MSDDNTAFWERIRIRMADHMRPRWATGGVVVYSPPDLRYGPAVSATDRWRVSDHLRSNDSMTRARTKASEYPFTEVAPELRDASAPTDTTAREQAQAWFEDKVVRAVRAGGYCTEALKIMDAAFGKPLDTVGVYDTRGAYDRNGYGSGTSHRLYPAYLDSDGMDCWNNVWRDKDGYARDGLNVDGLDKDGYDKNGHDKDGYDREGKDASGMAKDDPARFKYDVRGYDSEGYNRNGFDRYGFNREGVNSNGDARPETMFAFDRDGYDAQGFNRDGYNRAGYHDDVVYVKYRRMVRAGERF